MEGSVLSSEVGGSVDGVLFPLSFLLDTTSSTITTKPSSKQIETVNQKKVTSVTNP